MPTLNLLAGYPYVDTALYWFTALDNADVTSSSSTQIELSSTAFPGLTYTLTGTSLTTNSIAGVDYISGGTVTGITISINSGVAFELTGLVMDGGILGAALIADRQGTDNAALENLFRSLTYTINGGSLPDFHFPQSSIEGFNLELTANNTYNLADGDDTVTAAGTGNDSIYGGFGADSLLGNDGNDSIEGGDDDDSLFGGLGDDVLYGGGGGGNDSLYGGDDNDSLTVEGVGRAEGGNGDDNIQTSGSASAFGGDGNDTITSFGFDTIFGGIGNDSLNAAFSGLGMTMHGDEGNDTLTGSTSHDALYGGMNDDVMTGLDGFDEIRGGDGNDYLHGGGDDDTLYGDAGNDTLSGGNLSDVLYGGIGDDRFVAEGDGQFDFSYGGDGNDTLVLSASSIAGHFDGGADLDDRLDGSAVTAQSLTVDLASLFYNDGGPNFSLISVEHVIGGQLGDTIAGSTAANIIDGRAGNDSISGDNGNDTLSAGGGDDTINGGDGDDRIIAGFGLSTFDGGTGNDTLEYQTVTFASGALIDLQAGTYVFQTTSLAWTGFENYVNSATGASFEQVTGTSGNNLLDFSTLSSLSAIVANGGAGTDTIRGSAGNDTLNGGASEDEVYGGAGDDLFVTANGGGQSGESLFGGEGNDTIQMDPVYFTGNVDGGDGARDLLDGSPLPSSLIVNLEASTYIDYGQSFAITGIEDVNGSSTGDTLTGNSVANILDGRNGEDSIYGGGGADTLLGGNDNDVLVGGAGADSMNGGDGIDTADYSSSTSGVQANLLGNAQLLGDAAGDVLIAIERLIGSAFEDYLAGSSSNDSLYGGGDNDLLFGDEGADLLDGGAGTIDRVFYNASTIGLRIDLADAATNTGIAAGDTFVGIEGVYGSFYNDTILGDTGANVLGGDAGRDQLSGGAGNDVIYGGDDNDTLLGGAGADLLNGGTGTRDVASYSDSSVGLRADLQVNTFNTGFAVGDTYSGIEDITGSVHADTMLGDTGNNIVRGEDGNDAWLDGRIGNDTVYGGAGNDVLIGGFGADILDGGAGTRDRVQYTDSTVGLRADIQVNTFNTGIAVGDTYSGIEDIYGSFSGDTLLGNTSNNIIWGDAGSDAWLDGRIGNDTVYGGTGNDVLIGGAGADLLDGGAGTRDRVQYTDSTVGLRVDIQVATFNTGVAAGDTYVGIEDIYGGFQNDTLLGDGGDNFIWGAAGNDQIDGRLGNDTLIGGGGNDTLVGGTGADVFLFETALGATNRDSVTGYTVADDTIQLENAIFTALTATGALAGTAFFSGAAATTAAHRIIYNTANGQLLYDADGTGAGAAVLFATLSTGLALAETEFVIV